MGNRVKWVALVALGFSGVALAAASPGGFDAEAATQAWLKTLNGAARAQSDAYFEGGYWITLWGALVGMVIDLVFLRSQLSARVRDWAERTVRRPFLQAVLYALPYTLFGAVVALPWTIYSGFIRERQYDLMNQSFGAWLGEWAIDQGVALVIMPFVIALIMLGIRKSPRGWWKVGTVISALFMGFMMLIAPVFISPLFNDYKPMPAGPLRDRIVAMAAAEGIPSDNIYVFDQSKQHKRISANVSGLGPTVRISLNDNLINRSTPQEVAAVMGHEMGHYTLHHAPRLGVLFALVFGLSFWAASRLVPMIIARWGGSWGLRGVDDLAALPVYFIIFGAALLVLGPVQKSIVRWHEAEADAYGLDVAKEPDAFASIALKLSEYRKISPGPIEEMLFYDHPSGESRIRRSMQWKAAHASPGLTDATRQATSANHEHP